MSEHKDLKKVRCKLVAKEGQEGLAEAGSSPGPSLFPGVHGGLLGQSPFLVTKADKFREALNLASPLKISHTALQLDLEAQPPRK